MIKLLSKDEYLNILSKRPRPKIYTWYDVSLRNKERIMNDCIPAVVENGMIFMTKKEFKEEELFWWSLTKPTTTNNIE